MEPAAAISATNVALARGVTTVLEELNFVVPDGAIVAVIGPNGAGKSTLAAAIAGRLRPREGSLVVLGEDVRHSDLRRLRTRIGYFSDELASQVVPTTSAREVVALGPRGGLRREWFSLTDQELDAADALLGHVGLGGYGGRALQDLSAGQRQRVLLARAFAGVPELIVLDEPTSHLDIIGREEALWALEELLAAANRPRAGLIVTHHVEELPRQVSHVLLLGSGTLCFGPRSLLADPACLAAVFGRRVRVSEFEGRLVARLEHDRG